MFELEKINSQKYKLNAPKGKAGERNSLLRKLINKHSKFVPNYMFAPSYKSGKWNGRTNVYSPTSIKAGYLRETIEFMNDNKIPWRWKNDVVPNDLPFQVDDTIDFYDFKSFCETLIDTLNPHFEEKNGFKLEIRDYQIDAAYKAITENLGIIEHGTGSGKSCTIGFIIGYLFYKKIVNKICIVVPRQNLVTQFKGDLCDLGFNSQSVGMLFAESKDIHQPIIIATNQTLDSMLTKERDEKGKIINVYAEKGVQDFYNQFDMVIADECHTTTSPSVSSVLDTFHKASRFIGTTGTLPEEELDKEVLFSRFGRVLDTKKMKELNETYDSVTKIIIGVLRYNFGKVSLKSKLDRISSTSKYFQEMEYLQEHEKYNESICNLIANNSKSRNIVVVVKRIAYGETIYERLNELCSCDVYAVLRSGKYKTDLKKSDEIIKSARENNKNFVIVSNAQIFSTGINIRSLDMVVLLQGGESKIKVCQSIGRSARRHEEQTQSYILDVSSNLKYDTRHLNKRMKIYKSEGFEVLEKEIVLTGDDLTDRITKLKGE